MSLGIFAKFNLRGVTYELTSFKTRDRFKKLFYGLPVERLLNKELWMLAVGYPQGNP